MKWRRRRKVWVIIAAVVVTATFIPVRSLNCPAWDVWVTDTNGQPVSGITVRLTCRNYSAERDTHEIDATTDARGHAVFRAKEITASFGRRLLVTLSSAVAGPHASFGPHASVFAFGKRLEGVAIGDQKNVVLDWTGKPDHVKSRIVVTPRNP